MLRCNADGGHKFISYLVYTAILKILALKKNINKARLSSQLSHIYSKTWITTAVSQDWFKNCFVPEAEKYCWGNNILFKILLIADNASADLHDFHSNVEFVFLPANISPPAYGSDGVIANFEAHYLQMTFGILIATGLHYVYTFSRPNMYSGIRNVTTSYVGECNTLAVPRVTKENSENFKITGNLTEKPSDYNSTALAYSVIILHRSRSCDFNI
jgi:hypothetical protein